MTVRIILPLLLLLLGLRPAHASGRVQTTELLSVSHYEGIDEDVGLQVTELRAGVAAYRWRDVALMGELHLSSLRGNKDGDVDTWGAGLALLSRWHLLRVGPTALHLDFGVGGVYSPSRFPSAGTPFNATRQYGVGITVALRPGIDLVLGARHLHISNGRGLVPENPSFDGYGATVGLAWNYPGGGR